MVAWHHLPALSWGWWIMVPTSQPGEAGWAQCSVFWLNPLAGSKARQSYDDMGETPVEGLG